MRHAPFAIRHSPFAIRHSPFAIRHSPFAIRHKQVSPADDGTSKIICIGRGKKSYQPLATHSYTDPVIPRGRCSGGYRCGSARRIDMSQTEEQQMLNSLAAISQDIGTLVTLVKELMLQEDTADQKAYTQLVHIAHKR
jgi:hypothetical protein